MNIIVSMCTRYFINGTGTQTLHSELFVAGARRCQQLLHSQASCARNSLFMPLPVNFIHMHAGYVDGTPGNGPAAISFLSTQPVASNPNNTHGVVRDGRKPCCRCSLSRSPPLTPRTAEPATVSQSHTLQAVLLMVFSALLHL